MMNYEPGTAADKLLEDRMAPVLARALRPILFSFEEQDMKTQAENSAIVDAVARAAWREFRVRCAKAST